MTKVSKYLMQNEVKERMFEVFWKTIADLKTTSGVKEFFQELLTPTEQIMLAKRLAISILLVKKYRYEDIIDIVKVSPATIGSISRWLTSEGRAFKNSIQKLLREEKQEEFWDNLEEFLSSLIPPGKGTNWKVARKEQYQKLRNRRYRRSIL